MTSDELKRRSKMFAHDCVKLAMVLPKDELGFHIRKQLIRSSTSVAANYRAACLSQSDKTFSAKISIVAEEADESLFWLEFILDEAMKPSDILEPYINEAKELTSIFLASRKTIQAKISNN